MNLYVANIPYNCTEDQLSQVFASCGEVKSAKIITDRNSGKSKGYGFVEMINDEGGRTAISQMNGYNLEGRQLKVNEARPRR